MSNLLRLGLVFLCCVTLVRGSLLRSEMPGYEEEPCKCVVYYLCINATITTTANRNLIDPRSIPRRSRELREATSSLIPSRMDACPNPMDVCCKLPNVVPPGGTPTAEPTYIVSPGGTPTAEPTCGLRNAQGVTPSLNGLIGEAEFGEFPWMVALLRDKILEGHDGILTKFKGGGSLIHPQVVLTAAQNVFPFRNDTNTVKIRAGEWDTQTKEEPLESQDIRVREIIIHEGYDDHQLLNDVALLILQEPVRAAEHIGFVCLPSQGQNFDFSSCFASGWGKDVFGPTGRYQTILKKGELPIVPSRPTCQNALRKAHLGPAYLLPESFICAGGNGSSDTCQGDGGGPLVCPIANHPAHYQQAGIVSWGLQCGDLRTPGVYANVALFRNWIDQKMDTLNFDKSSYTYSN